jgi:thiamine-phosphate diphosphorylase
MMKARLLWEMVNLMRAHALHLITTGRQELEDTVAIARQCPSEMIDVLHIREKHRSASDIMRWHEALSKALPRTRIYINDRVDAAFAVHACGIHLGFSSIPMAEARKLMPSDTRIGLSVHSVAEAIEAEQAGADYVIFGHIYATSSKAGLEPRGIAALAEVVEAVELPVIAIGGIEPDKVEEVLSTGCSGIAVMSSVFLHPEPSQQIIRFRAVLDRCNHQPRRLQI